MSTSRLLGPHESYGTVQSKLGCYTNVVLSATLYTPTTHQGLLYAAEILLEKESLLGVTISGQEGSFKMTKMREAKLDGFVDASLNEKTLREVIKDLHNVLLDLSKQHWKLYLLNSGQEIAFLFDHALMDGVSGLVVIEEVVKALKDFKSRDYTPQTTLINQNLPLPLPVEQQMRVSVPLTLLLKELYKEYIYRPKPTSLPRQKLNWTGRHSIIDFSALQSRAFYNMCKSHGFSVGAGLYGLLVCASSGVLHRKYPDAVSRPVDGLIPLNGRNFSPNMDKRRLGMVVGQSALRTVVPQPNRVEKRVPCTDFVTIAQQFKAQIARDTKPTLFSGYPFMQPVGLIPWVNSLSEYFKKHTDNSQRASMFELSNLTVSDAYCEQLRFSQCTGGISPFIQCNVVGLKGKGMSIGLGVTDDEEVLVEVERYIRWFVKECEVYAKVEC